MKKLLFENSFSKFEEIMMRIGWYKILNFIEEWVYPAYSLRNILFHRHDLIKIPQVKCYEYTDLEFFMLCANMQMIVNFIEKENPEKYILWYKDEDGNDVGHKYGENPNYQVLFPEYKGKWIMDIIKEIYHWWKEEYPILCNDKSYLLSFWCEYFSGSWEATEEDENGNVLCVHSDKNIAKSMNDLDEKNIKWDIIDKYIDRNRLFEDDYVHMQYEKMETDIYNMCQKYLHLCIEVRPYLWT